MSEDDVDREGGFDCAEKEPEDEGARSEGTDGEERTLEESGYGYGV